MKGNDGLRIKSDSTGDIEKVSLYNYTLGAIAAEMPPDFHLEALKAQGVASLTYALRQRAEASASGAEYDFTADPENRPGYTTENNARKDYGDNFSIHWTKM